MFFVNFQNVRISLPCGPSILLRVPCIRPCITNAPYIYTFREWRLNGFQLGTNPKFNKVYSTADPATLVYTASYDRTTLLPALVQVSPNFTNPVPATTNFVLAFLPDDGPTTAEVAERVRAKGLYVRDAAGIGSGVGPRAIRIAVKDARTNAWMIDRLAEAMT